MTAFELRRDNILASTDPAKIDHELVYGYLVQAYWSENLPRDIFERSVEHSLCFGVYITNESKLSQVAFARVISDLATYAYIGDVFVLEEHRGKGYSKFLMEAIKAHPDLQGLRRWTLATRDAHGLYSQFGFTPVAAPEHYMEIKNPGIYKKPQG